MYKSFDFSHEEPFHIGDRWYIEGKERKQGNSLIALHIPEAYVGLIKVAQAKKESSVKRGLRNELLALSRQLVPTMIDPVLTAYSFLKDKAVCELRVLDKRIMHCEAWYAVLVSILWNKPLQCDDAILAQQEIERADVSGYHTHSLQLALRLLNPSSTHGAMTESLIYRELGKRCSLLGIMGGLQK